MPKMNVNKVLTRDYGKIRPDGSAKTNPIKPNTNSKRSADPYGQAPRNTQTGDPTCRGDLSAEASAKAEAHGEAGFAAYYCSLKK